MTRTPAELAAISEALMRVYYANETTEPHPKPEADRPALLPSVRLVTPCPCAECLAMRRKRA